ncbi:MAG TPA: toll/interleukin-1 receptor domain-containing protein [bacterium]|jgi:hypothetical protein
MAFLSENQLRTYAADPSIRVTASRFEKSFAASARISLLLSHSHKDHQLAEGLKNFLASQGVDLYIDWKDHEMTPPPTAATADKIKGKIRECGYFMLLATQNGLASRWVPWELGIADGFKARENIFVVPVDDAYGKTHGSEYILLYPSIQISQLGVISMFAAGSSYSPGAGDWLRQRAARGY